jgi:hypothetical protein
MATARSTGDQERLRNDPLLRDLLAQRDELRADNDGPAFRVDFFAFKHSFAWNRIRHGNPFHGAAREKERAGLRAIQIERFEDDPGFRQSIAALLRAGVPILPVHLPHQAEIIAGLEFEYPRAGGTTEKVGTALRESLETAVGKPSIALLKHLGAWRADPGAYIISPTDLHPNRKGTELFAAAIADALIENGVASFIRR